MNNQGPDRMFDGRPVIGIRNAFLPAGRAQARDRGSDAGRGNDVGVDEGRPEDIASKGPPASRVFA
jgi:hypothetical protein